jgi:peptidoglycan/LPS O-acetylase OafA/YrhL
MEDIHSKAQLKPFGLGHLRALAILLVLGFHYQLQFTHPGWTGWFMKIGWTGIDLFLFLVDF